MKDKLLMLFTCMFIYVWQVGAQTVVTEATTWDLTDKDNWNTGNYLNYSGSASVSGYGPAKIDATKGMKMKYGKANSCLSFKVTTKGILRITGRTNKSGVAVTIYGETDDQTKVSILTTGTSTAEESSSEAIVNMVGNIPETTISVYGGEKDYFIKSMTWTPDTESSDGLTLEDETAHNLIFAGAWDAAKFTELVSGKEVWSVNLTGVTNITGDKPTDISNPNCLYYVKGDLWENEVNVVNDDAKTAKSIRLADGTNNLFYNRVGFTATAASYTRTFTAAGTYSICLPFAVANIPGEVTVLEYKGSNGAKVNFSQVSAMAANTPYLVEVSADNINKEIKFEAANITVEASASVSVADAANNAYTFNSNFEPFTTTAAQGLYLLEAGGTGFVKAGTASVGSFRAYIAPVSNELAKAPRLVIGNDEGGATGIDASQAISRELSVYSAGGVLELNSPVAQCVKVYGVDGRLVRVLQLSEGNNIVSGLAKGMYIIANRKVVIK